MRYRPKRENYAIGQFGEIDHQEKLERYCTYLENQNKQLRLYGVVGRSEQLVCGDCSEGRDEFAPEWECPKCRDKDYAN